MTPVTLIAAAFAVPDSTSDQVLQRAGLGLIAQLFVGAVMALGWPIAQRLSRPRPFVLLWVLLAYALRGVILSVAFTAAALPDHLSPLLRVLGSMFTMSVWALVIATALSAHDYYRAQLKFTLKHVEGLTSSVKDSWHEGDSLFLEFESTRRRLSDVLEAPRDSDIASWAAVLRQSIEEDLRPLSHRMWAEGARGVSGRERLQQFVWRVSKQPIPIVEVAFVLIALTSWNALLRYEVTSGLITALTYILVLAALLTMMVGLRRYRILRTGTQSILEILVITLVAPAVVAALSLPVPHLPGEPLGILVLTLNGFFVVLLLVAIWATIEGSRTMVEQAQDDVQVLDLLIEERADMRSKQLTEAARYLHNSVQSRLLRLQIQATSSGPTEQFTTDISETRRLLSELSLDRLPSPKNALRDLHSAVDSWSGIANVTISLARNLPTEHPLTPQLALFAEEAIANSIRHGQATSVQVSLSELDGNPVLTITDNGTWMGPEEIGQGRHGPFVISVDQGDSTTTISARPLVTRDIPSHSSR